MTQSVRTWPTQHDTWRSRHHKAEVAGQFWYSCDHKRGKSQGGVCTKDTGWEHMEKDKRGDAQNLWAQELLGYSNHLFVSPTGLDRTNINKSSICDSTFLSSWHHIVETELVKSRTHIPNGCFLWVSLSPLRLLKREEDTQGWAKRKSTQSIPYQFHTETHKNSESG